MLTIHGSRPYRFSAVVDTGFNGHLMLSRRHCSRMTLAYAAFQEYELADGRVRKERIYLGDVTFDGHRHTISVMITRSAESLVGTSLLRRKTLTISFPARRVVIR